MLVCCRHFGGRIGVKPGAPIRYSMARRAPLHGVYCSRESVPFYTAGIEGLVAVGEPNNARHSITGWLVYSCGVFFQWLEGSRQDVQRLMLTIVADPRQDTIVVLT